MRFASILRNGGGAGECLADRNLAARGPLLQGGLLSDQGFASRTEHFIPLN